MAYFYIKNMSVVEELLSEVLPSVDGANDIPGDIY